jgi:hypothetical protein
VQGRGKEEGREMEGWRKKEGRQREGRRGGNKKDES